MTNDRNYGNRRSAASYETIQSLRTVQAERSRDPQPRLKHTHTQKLYTNKKWFIYRCTYKNYINNMKDQLFNSIQTDRPEENGVENEPLLDKLSVVHLETPPPSLQLLCDWSMKWDCCARSRVGGPPRLTDTLKPPYWTERCQSYHIKHTGK